MLHLRQLKLSIFSLAFLLAYQFKSSFFILTSLLIIYIRRDSSKNKIHLLKLILSNLKIFVFKNTYIHSITSPIPISQSLITFSTIPFQTLLTFVHSRS
jgi:hypothetical protein